MTVENAVKNNGGKNSLTTNFYQATLLATIATKKYLMLPDVMEKPLLLSAARLLWKRLSLNCLRLSKALTLR